MCARNCFERTTTRITSAAPKRREPKIGVVTRKAVRQKLLQAAVLEKIEHEHLSVNTDRVREKVQSIRSRVTGKSLHRCLESVGTQSSFGNDIEAVCAVVGSDDAHTREMRDLTVVDPVE